MKLDAAVLSVLEGPIYRVWDYIGYDVMQCAEECGDESVSNADAIESCIDAGRLTMQNFKEADDLVHALCKEHTYTKLLKFLSKNIQLV